MTLLEIGSSLAPLPVVLPLVAAGAALAMFRHPRVQRAISLSVLSAVFVTSLVLLFAADQQTLTVNVGGWAAPIGISLVVDRLAALMLTVSSFVTLCVLIYTIAQDNADDDDKDAPLSIFHPTYLVLTAGVSNAFLTGDLFNLYVGFEILLTASYVLLTIGGSAERIRAGATYVVVAIVSSVIFLVAIGFAYSATGTVNLAQLAIRLPQIDSGTQLLIQSLLLVAFGLKAAVFPLSFWLPDSYPTAPASVTAVFAGLLTKVGVYAIIRTQTLLFPSGRLNGLLLLVAIATMVVGILGALAQSDLKRLLSFTLVSHIGYMIFGIGLADSLGLAAAIFYVAHHITVQTALFLVAGLVERFGGTTSLDRLGSLAKLSPLLGILFFIPAMNLAGIPPLSGFLGKLGLIEAGVQVDQPVAYAAVIASLVTSLLTLYALTKAWNRAFWQDPPEALPPSQAIPKGMIFSAGALVAGGLALTVLAGPLYGYAQRSADQLEGRSDYIFAVLPDGQRGRGESTNVTEDAADPQKVPEKPPQSSTRLPVPASSGGAHR